MSPAKKHLSNTRKHDILRPTPQQATVNLNANTLQSSYARIYHTAVSQAMSCNINFPHIVSDDTPEYYYKQSDNRDVVASCHIPDDTEQSGTHFLYTEKSLLNN